MTERTLTARVWERAAQELDASNGAEQAFAHKIKEHVMGYQSHDRLTILLNDFEEKVLEEIMDATGLNDD